MRKGGSINLDVLTAYLCQRFGVADIADIDPFGSNAIPAHSLVKKVNARLCTQIKGLDVTPANANSIGGDIGIRQNEKDNKLAPADKVIVAGATYTHVTFTRTGNPDLHLGLRVNFLPRSYMSSKHMMEDDEAIVLAGGVPRISYEFRPTTKDGADLSFSLFDLVPVGPYNEGVMQTLALIRSEADLMRGVLKIPPDVCREAGLPIAKSEPDDLTEDVLKQLRELDIDPAEAMAQRKTYFEHIKETHLPIEYYYAVPTAHVFATALVSPAYSQDHRINVPHITVHPAGRDPYVLYFIVSNATLEEHVAPMMEVIRKFDVRPFSDIGIELIPMSRTKNTSKATVTEFMLTGRMTLLALPRDGTYDPSLIVATRSPNFPRADDFSPTHRAQLEKGIPTAPSYETPTKISKKNSQGK